MTLVKYMTGNLIAFRLFVTVLIISLIATLLITAFTAWSDYRTAITDIENQIKEIETIHLPVIRENLWVMDKKTVNAAIKGLLNVPYLKQITIEANGKVIMKAGSIETGPTQQREFPLFYNYREKSIQLGVMKIYITMDDVYEELWRNVKKELFNNVIFVFIIAFSIYFLFQALVTRHLASIASYVKQIGIGDFKSELLLQGRKLFSKNPDEIDRIVSAINSMRIELNNTFDGLQNEIMIRQQAEKALRESEEKFRILYNHSPDMYVSISPDDARILLCNKTFLENTGYSREEIIGSSIFKMYHNDCMNEAKKSFQQFVEIGVIKDKKLILKRKDGSKINVSLNVVALRDDAGKILYSISSWRDITTQKQAEEEIKASLKEKETLLQEIHHRVKNNMAIIVSLLSLQMHKTDDNRIKGVLQEIQNRIYSMSAVHETLYNSENLSEIPVKPFIGKIVEYVFQSYQINPRQICLKTEFDAIKLNVDKASPLGLAINELVSNAIKYAFPNERKGEITVSMKKLDKRLELIVSDDGVGIPENFDWPNPATLGLQLVRALVENQLEGSLDMENKNGTKFIINFNMET